MKLSALVTLTLLSGILLTADVVTQATCSLANINGSGSAAQTAPAACSVSLGGNGGSSASISGTITSAGFDVNGTVMSVPAAGQSGTADVTASGSLSLTTAGPIRGGFAIITGVLTGSEGIDPITGTLGVTLGSLNASCAFFPGLLPAAPCGGLVPLSTGPLKLAFLLGQPFTFSEAFHLNAASVQFNVESGAAAMHMGFQLFEADGVTPVAVSSTPEPAGVSLFCTGLIALALGRKRFPGKR